MADPTYRRIAEELRQAIESGRISRGSQLPTESELSEQFGASRNTIRDAVKFLIGLGMVETRPGQGTFEETPWSMQTSFYPRRFALEGATRLLDDESIEQGTVKYLEETLGVKQTGYRDWITVRAPDDYEVSFFRLPADGRIPVSEIFRTAFDQEGKPMRVTVTIFPTDRNQFTIDVGDVPAPQYEAAVDHQPDEPPQRR
jgi:DNA-binding GntR family transcriptional regulator